MPDLHANLSPSSADRWINCPASVRMIAEHADDSDDGGSAYAREGTLAHGLGEIEASHTFGLSTRRQYLDAKLAWLREFDAEAAAQDYPEGTLEEMREYVHGYVRFLAERLKATPGSQILLEQRMDSGVPECWGTSDAVIFSPTHVEIVDLKYGQGVAVSAYGNYQLRLYGLGALDTYGDILGDTETVSCTVYQPRVNSVSTETLPADELRAWRTDVAIPGAAATKDPEAPFGPGEKACRWCPVKNICRARMEAATAEDFGTSPSEIVDNAEIAELLHKLPLIKAWASDLEAYALAQAYTEGGQLPGWKVVISGGKRSIVKPQEAIEKLVAAGHPQEKVADLKPKALGTLEKLVGKARLPELLGDTIAKGSGKPSLVAESHPGEAVTAQSSAANDFAQAVEE